MNIVQETAEKLRLDEAEKKEFFEYFRNRYADLEERPIDSHDGFPVWKKVMMCADFVGAEDTINMFFCKHKPMKLRDKAAVSFDLAVTEAGEVPLIIFGDVEDFEEFAVRVVFKDKRPDTLERTGAMFVYGEGIRFLVLSRKPYSNVRAEELSLEEEVWLSKSLELRKEHECTHFLTKSIYGLSENRLHDELMADFMGLYETFGFYSSEWFCRFMGIIPGGGSRLIVYTGDLSERVREAAAETVRLLSLRLEKWSETEEFRKLSSVERLKFMCKSLYEL